MRMSRRKRQPKRLSAGARQVCGVLAMGTSKIQDRDFVQTTDHLERIDRRRQHRLSHARYEVGVRAGIVAVDSWLWLTDYGFETPLSFVDFLLWRLPTREIASSSIFRLAGSTSVSPRRRKQATYDQVTAGLK